MFAISVVNDYTEHYDHLSQFYDRVYGNENTSSVASVAIKYLDLQPDDMLADVGGGTGGIAEIIHKKVGKYQRYVQASSIP